MLTRAWRVVALIACASAAWLMPAAPALAAPNVTANGVALAASASCAYGDVEIAYDASSVDQQAVTFTSTGGAVLQDRTTKAYQASFGGTERVLAEATAPPAAGTVVAVHVVVGSAPLTGSTAAEFTVAYRCDTTGNKGGGNNVVLWSCFGDLGACPRDADEALATAATPGAVPGAAAAPMPASVATPVIASPSFTG